MGLPRQLRQIRHLNNAPVGILITLLVQHNLGIGPFVRDPCSTCNTEPALAERLIESEPQGNILTKSIRLSINGDSFEVGLARDDEVYLPWSWIEPYFDVYGRLDTSNDIFYFTNANSHIQYAGNDTYTSKAGYMNFASYTVENRERVKVVDGTHGVPISTQWSPDGYFYPIQIAQYALVAYTKNITTTNKVVRNLLEHDKEFIFDDSTEGYTLTVNEPKLVKLQLTGTLQPGAMMIVYVDVKDIQSGRVRHAKIKYVALDVPLGQVPRISYEKETYTVTIGIGKRTEKSTFTRDIANDVIKGIGCREAKSTKKHNLRLKDGRIEKIEFIGAGHVTNLTLANIRYEANFYDAANWLERYQDESGKWPIRVEKELESYPTLQPGWVSSMAQGQAISVMVRAAQTTGEVRFWQAAQKALAPFHCLTSEGGVRNIFHERYVWYEEYPFEEGLFVLNGFMYSLIGLYDLSSAENAPRDARDEAKELFDEGLVSLKALLPLYDNGKGSNYDLQHVIKQVRGPNRARWDYHTVHIQQLNLFKSVFRDDAIFAEFAARWTGYLNGHYSDHN